MSLSKSQADNFLKKELAELAKLRNDKTCDAQKIFDKAEADAVKFKKKVS